jgi:hypothetical protein
MVICMVIMIFSHAYVIMHKYFGKKLEMLKMNTYVFIENLTCFLAWKFRAHVADSWATNSKPNEYNKSTKWQNKNHFPCSPFRMDIIVSKFLYCILFHQMHYMKNSKHKCMHNLFMKENWNQLHCLIHSSNSYKLKIAIKTRTQVI